MVVNFIFALFFSLLLVWNWCLVRTWGSFWVGPFLSQSTLCGCDCIPRGHVWLGDSNGMVRHVEIEIKNSALVGMLKRHIRTIERITDLKLTSHSNMMIILSSSIFEPSQHSVAVTVYHVVIYVQAIDLLWYQFNFIPHIGSMNVALIPCSNDSWASFDEWAPQMCWSYTKHTPFHGIML